MEYKRNKGVFCCPVLWCCGAVVLLLLLIDFFFDRMVIFSSLDFKMTVPVIFLAAKLHSLASY
jgi:hypothetical protein